MTVLILGTIALAAVVLSFALVALTLTRVIPNDGSAVPTSKSPEIRDDQGSVSETMSRVLGEVERLAELRERGALTDKEFEAEKAKFLRVGNGGDRPQLPHRTP